jgi:hypothetical protein
MNDVDLFTQWAQVFSGIIILIPLAAIMLLLLYVFFRLIRPELRALCKKLGFKQT